jgi:hypothetical protein
MYATVERLKRDHLSQLLETSEHDGALGRCLDDATSIIDLELGFSLAAAAEAGTSVVYGDGTTVLRLPPGYVAGSLTGVTTTSGYTVPDDYVERDGYLYVTTADGGLLSSTYPRWPYRYDPFVAGGVWTDGAPFTIAGEFGGVPGPIARLCCELAVVAWRLRENPSADAIGTESAVIQIRAGITPAQQRILDHYSGTQRGGFF